MVNLALPRRVPHGMFDLDSAFSSMVQLKWDVSKIIKFPLD